MTESTGPEVAKTKIARKKTLGKVTNVRITRPIKTREDIFKGLPIRKKR